MVDEQQPKAKIKRFYIAREFSSFLRVTRKWWMLPLIIALIIAAFIIVFGQSSALSPFIYALF